MDSKTFGDVFKLYKRKNPPPDFVDVLDLRNLSHLETVSSVVPLPLTRRDFPQVYGLLPVERWRAYTLQDFPGFVFIVNPFVNNAEWYWVKQCVEDYTKPPNHSNLDSLVSEGAWNDAWLSKVRSGDKTLLKKLYWVTLGIHHNWDTKIYSLDEQSPMPADLCLLSQYVASALGWSHYSPEAAIMNYYHAGSSLGGHTDHSEFDLNAPLISFSFGLSAIFLLGGATKDTTPLAFYVDSGDIVVMSGQSRLSYHGVPRILTPAERSVVSDLGTVECNHSSAESVSINSEPCTNSAESCMQSEKSSAAVTKSTSLSGDTTTTCATASHTLDTAVQNLNVTIAKAVESLDCLPFAEFFCKTRLNINVRQVFIQTDVKHGHLHGI